MEFSKDKTLRVAIAPGIINKSEGVIPNARFAKGFFNQKLTLEQLLSEIQQGRAYCPEMRGNRKKENFSASDVISLDVDEGSNFEEMLQDPFVKEHASIIYTTPSHTEELHRFRIIFVLPRTIVDAQEMTRAMRGLAMRFGGDQKVVDAAHLFYGSKDCRSFMQHRALSPEALDTLIERGSAPRANSEGYGPAVRRDSLNFDRLALRLADGGSLALAEIPKGSRVHCPEHIDRRPSAFVTENALGIKGVFCSACARTYWPKAVDPNLPNTFDHDLERIAAGEALEGAIGVERVHLSRSTIQLRDSRFLGSLSLIDGAMFVKSAKGTGKTEALKDVVRATTGRVLVIGHRKTLVEDLCNKLELDFYASDTEDGASVNWDRRRRFGVTIDSVWMARVDQPFDLIVLDESEQVLSHLMSQTISARRNSVFVRFRHLVANARRVICCDADLSWLSLNSVMDWRDCFARSEPAHVIYNKRQLADGTISLYRTRKQLLASLLQASKLGRCYVTSNSKRTIDQIEAMLIASNPNIVVLKLTEDTPGRELSTFLKDPPKHILRYDVILASPKVSSGLDITFPDGAQLISDVFGFFEPGILNHYECDQQLSRVRSPKRTHVWLSYDDPGDIEVTADVMRIRLARDFMFGYLHRGYSEYGDLRIDHELADNDKLLDLAVRVVSRDELSRNSRRENFLRYKKSQGWKIEVVDDVELQNMVASQHDSDSREMDYEKINTATSLNHGDLLDLLAKRDEGVYLRPDELASIARTEMEAFYGRRFDSELWELSNVGPSRSAVIIYEDLLDNGGSPVRETNHAREALERAHIYEAGQLATDVPVTGSDLAEFGIYIRENKQRLESQLSIRFRSDFQDKPIQALNMILEKMGLSVVSYLKTKSKGKSILVYKLDEKKVEALRAVVAARVGRC